MGVCDEGIKSPLPPCLYSECFQACAENQPCCRAIGRCGPKNFEKQPLRARIMLTAAFLSFSGVVMQLIPVISLSEDVDIIMATSWSTFEIDSTLSNATTNEVISDGVEWDGYISPNGLVIDGDGDPEFIDWDDTEYCNDIYFDNCDDCRDAAEGVFSVAILSFLTALPQLSTDIQRSHLEGDVNCQRTFGIVTGLVGCVSGVLSVLTYIQSCGEGFPDDGETVIEGIRIESEFSYRFGPSAVLLLIASLLKLVDVLVHCIVPVPEVTILETTKTGAEVDALKGPTKGAP